jgi:hypothetical protein
VESDTELERWRVEWRAHDAIPPSLVRRVERDRRRMRWNVAGEIAITIAMGAGSLGWAIASRRADVAMLAAGVWILIAIAWTISILLRRGAWQPAATTTTAFIEISLLRCERRLLAITIQAWMYALILGFDLVWLYSYRGETSVWTFLTRPAVVLIAWVGTAVAGAGAIWYRKRLRRELENLRKLRRELESPLS